MGKLTSYYYNIKVFTATINFRHLDGLFALPVVQHISTRLVFKTM